MLSVISRIPSETHPRQAAEFVFSFWMINMLCFAWSLNISHIFALSSRFSNFFRFFWLASFARLFWRASCFFAWSFNISRFLHLSNALLRIFQFFWKTFRRTPCHPQSLKKHFTVKTLIRTVCFQISSLVISNGVIFVFFNQHRCHFFHHAT